MTVLGNLVALLLALVAPDPEALDAFVRDQSERAGAPGVAWAVVGPDGVEQHGVAGSDGDGEPVTAQAPFLWGSVSKPVTATLAVLLARDGVLDLDAEVDGISVRQLLDHTSGLPEGLQLTDRYDDSRSIAALTDEAAELERGEVGEHSYSSLNYVLLAAAIEDATGRPYAQVLRERLLEPAGMATTHGDAAEAEAVLPPGHRYVLGSARAFDSEVDPATVPAGYLVGSLDDLAAFAQTQLSASAVLSAEERALLHTATTKTGDDTGYGLGWRTGTVPGTTPDSRESMVWHGGAAPGYTSAVLLLPERDQAVVVLLNAYGPFHETALLDTAFGLAAELAGAEPERAGTDPGYPIALVVLGLLDLLLVLLILLALRQRPTSGRRVAVSLVVLALVGAGLWMLPGFAGVTLGQLGLWAPDLSWFVHGGLVLTAALAALRVTALVRTRRRRVVT